MTETNLASAVDYYTAMSNKDLPGLEKYLHPYVRFVTPLAELSGKEEVVEAAENFFNFFEDIAIRAQFASENQAMLALEVNSPSLTGVIRTASLLTFEAGLIVSIELYYDSLPFIKNKDEIFSS